MCSSDLSLSGELLDMLQTLYDNDDFYRTHEDQARAYGDTCIEEEYWNCDFNAGAIRSNIWEISQKLRQKIDNWCGAFYNSHK